MPVRPISLDTNVIVRLVVGDVPAHTAAASVLLESRKCYVSDVVVAEAVYTLQRIYGLERSEITRMLLYIFRTSQVIYNSRLLDAVFEFYERRSSLSFVDCYAAMEAGIRDHELATFDKKLTKAFPHIKEP